MNNFDIDDAVLQLLKNYLHQNLCFICIWQPLCFYHLPLQSVSGLVQVYQTLEFQEAAAHQLLENSHCQGSLPVSISHL
jgi:hypothetical protein